MLLYALIALSSIGNTPADDVFAHEKSLGHVEIRTVAKSTDAEYYAFPSVCRLSSGDLICVFYNGSAHVCPDSKVALVRSADNGNTWSKPVTIIDTPMDDRDPSIMQTHDGRILVSFFTRDSRTTGSAKESNKVLVSASDDGGKTFGAPRHIDVDWQWEATSDEILELQNGTLLCPIYGMQNKEDKTWRAAVAFSTDGGLTWNKQPTSTIAYDGVIRYEEPALVQLPNGTILCEMRTTNADGFIYESKSTDNGKTWSKPRKLDLFGQASSLLHHSSGVLLHAYRYRKDNQTQGVAGILCRPDKEWNPGKQFMILADIGDVAYPSSVELGDGSILTVYYVRNHRAIEVVVFSPEAIRALK